MTESPVKDQPGRPPKQKRVAIDKLERWSKEEIFDRNMAIAWEESVLYASRNIDYVPEGEFLKKLMEENPEFSEEEIQISFRKLNEEAKRIFDENQEMIEADKPVQQETMFWGSMAELDELDTVQDREIKVWLLEHPPSQCTRKRPAPKRKLVPMEPERTDLTEEEKAARVTDLIDSVSKGETSQDYTPDSFPSLMELRTFTDVVPPKIPKVPKPREKHPLSYSKTNTIPMLLGGAQIGGPQSGPTVAEYLKSGKFAVKKRPNDPNDWVSVLRSGLGSRSGSAFDSGFGQSSGSGFGSGPNLGSGAASGLTVGEYLNQKLLTEGLIPAFGSGLVLGSAFGHQERAQTQGGGSGPKKGSGPVLDPGTHAKKLEKPQDHQEDREVQAPEALGSGLALGSSGSASGCSGLTPAARTEAPKEDPSQDEAPQEDHAPQPSNPDPSHQDSENHLEEDRDALETSNSSPPDGSQAQRDEVSQEDLDALRLAAGYQDLGPQYDDDGAQNYFYPEDEFFEEDQGDFEPRGNEGSQAREDEDPEKELENPGSGAQDGSQEVDGVEDSEISGSRQMPTEEDHGEILGPQEEAGADSEPEPEDHEDNRQDSSGSGLHDGSQAQEDQASDALGLGQMPVEDHEMDSGSDLNEDSEDSSELLDDAQRAKSPESSGPRAETSGSRTGTSGSETTDLGLGAVVAQHQGEYLGAQVQEYEDLEPEDQEEDLEPGTQNDFGLQGRLGSQENQEQEASGPVSDSGPYADDEEPQEDFEPEDDLGHQAQAENDDHGPHEDQDSESGGQEEEPQDSQCSQDQYARDFQVPDHGRYSGRQDPEDQYENDEDDDFGLEDLDEEDSGRWGDEEEDSVYRDQEDQDPEPFGLVSGHQDSGHQSPQDYYEAQGNEDDELKDQIELQEVQEPKLPGSSVGRQDFKPQRPHIELQEYQDPNLSQHEPMNPTRPLLQWGENGNFGAQKRLRTPEPEVEPEPKRFSPERGHYSGVPVWEMYQRAKKMFEDLAKKEALRSSGQLQESSEDDDEESFGSESPRASSSSSPAPILTAYEQANNEEDVEDILESDSPLTSRTSTPIPTAPIPTDHYNDLLETPEPIVFAQREKTPEQPALVHQHIVEYNEEFFENESSQLTRDSVSSSATPIPTGSESPNAEEPLIYDHDYLHKIEYEIAAMQANDIIYDDVYEDDQGSHSPRNSSPIPTAPTPEALEPEIYDADVDEEFRDNVSPQRSRGSSPIPAASSPAREQQHIEEHDVEFSENVSLQRSRESSPIPAAPCPAQVQENNEEDDGESFASKSLKRSRSSPSSSVAHEQGNNEEDDGELSDHGSSRAATPIPEDPHNDLLKTPEPIVIAQREKTPEPVGIPPGYEELLLNYSPFRATLKLIERQLRLPLTAEELANLLEDARRNSMNQSSQEPKRKRSRWF